MSQKQQTASTNKHPQGLKGWRKGNNNSRGDQIQGGGGTPRVNTYTGNTIRAQEHKRRTVFKAALDSPFSIGWQVSCNTRSNPICSN
jgi:hypothetical protein